MKFFKKLQHKMDMRNKNLDEQCHLDDLIKPETEVNDINISQSEIQKINIDRFVTEGLSIKHSIFNELQLIKSYATKIYLEELHSNLKLSENIYCSSRAMCTLDDVREGIIIPDSIDTNIPINKCDVSFDKIEGSSITIKDLYIKNINITSSNFHTLNLINLNLDNLIINLNWLHSINIQNCNIKNIEVKNSELHSIKACLKSTIKNLVDDCSSFGMNIYKPEKGNPDCDRYRLGLYEGYKYNPLTGKLERENK